VKFGAVPVKEAEGAILAHSVQADKVKFRKGLRIETETIDALTKAGIGQVVVAQPEVGDVGEDEAAARLAGACAPDPDDLKLKVEAPFTGRVNLFAEAAGVLEVDAAAVSAINAVDPDITLATLPDRTRVALGDMLATVKIIPYAVSGDLLEAALAAAEKPVFRVHPFHLGTAALVMTRTPAIKEKVITKGEEVVRRRLEALGVDLVSVETVAHETEAVSEAVRRADADIVLILGASATSDRRDVCPAGLVAAGGTLERFGMPVDPGNLLFLGRLNDKPVVGMPGCARSPALNGADWVLERIVAGLEVTSADIAAMGVGGLLMEIPSRPQPRAFEIKPRRKPKIEVILLAAGASRRMGGEDKLLKSVNGEALLRRATKAALASGVDAVHVVLPPDNAARRAVLFGLDASIVEATDAAEGMAASIRAGLAVVSPRTDAIVLALADMPEVGAAHIRALSDSFAPQDGREICRAVTAEGSKGHPVLFGRRFFESLAGLKGDQGAKSIVEASPEFVVDVVTDGEGAVIDLDTPEAWSAYLEQQASEPGKTG
jgi:molybdenum cofactor cytidylyltransferase